MAMKVLTLKTGGAFGGTRDSGLDAVWEKIFLGRAADGGGSILGKTYLISCLSYSDFLFSGICCFYSSYLNVYKRRSLIQIQRRERD